MASAVADRTSRRTTADAIEAELSDLWREVGRREPVARAVMSNLVVFRDCDSPGDPHRAVASDDLPLEAVTARHPSRVILVARGSEGARTDRAPTATVSVVTYGPPQARFGVEVIAVHISCGDAGLPSIVRRLIRGDVPTSLWWPGDLSHATPIDPLVDIGRQLVYDSRRWTDVEAGVRALAPAFEHRRIDCADVNWRRLTPVRHALLHAGDELTLAELHPANVRIVHRPGDAALGWLFAGWLASRVGSSTRDVPEIVEASQDDRVLSVEVGRHGEPSTIRLTDQRLTVKQRGWPEYTTAVRQETDADAIAAELRALSPDVCLRDALLALLRHVQ
jgi:glucose-6-phosphate dehydrogenase assembly protein OpcA